MKSSTIFESILKTIPKTTKDYVDTSFDISNKIYNALKEKNIDIMQFCKECNINRKKFNKWISGTYNFTIYEIIKIENVLDIKLIKLL